MARFKKLIFPVAAAIAATVAWVIDPSVVPPEIPAGAWVVVAGVFGLKNAAA